MARSITPERQELRAEAIQLRKAGWTQPDISRALAVPQQTLSKWLITGNIEAKNTHSLSIMSNHSEAVITHNNRCPITLFPCKYEEVGDGIAPGSIDLILTDPPYLVSNTDMSRKNQANLQRDFGIWDNIPQKQYEASVSLWAG